MGLRDRVGRVWPHLLRWLVGLLWLAAFALLAAIGAVAIYATYYYFLIVWMHPFAFTHRVQPPVSYRVPLYFDFTALLDFHASESRIDLRTDDDYAFSIELDMPESDDNQNLGMFMISLDVMSMDKELMVHSRRPAMMRYYSLPIRLATTILYAVPYLAGIALERQRLRIPLLSKWRPNAEAKAALYTLTPHKPNTHMQLYSAHACIDTDLRGFRYLAYHWFISTTIVSISSLQFVLFFVILWLCWGHMTAHLRSIRPANDPRRRRHNAGEAERAPAHVAPAPAVSQHID